MNIRATTLIFYLVSYLLTGAIEVLQAQDKTVQQIPRFQSLKSDKVNLRRGPGIQYQIDWILQRKWLPVEIITAYERWRRIRTIDGTEGWVLQNFLSNKRTALVVGNKSALYGSINDNNSVIAFVEPGVTVHLLSCRLDWCKVESSDLKGWMTRTALWGLSQNEALP